MVGTYLEVEISVCALAQGPLHRQLRAISCPARVDRPVCSGLSERDVIGRVRRVHSSELLSKRRCLCIR